MEVTSTTSQAYINILEKTNQQLSLWYNPYGLMVGILTILVAFLAIVFTFLLWKQSRDYKDSFNIFLREQKRAIDKKIGEVLRDGKKLIDKLNSDIESVKVKSTKVKGKEKEALEREIKDLEKKKSIIEEYPLAVLTNINHTSSLSGIEGNSDFLGSKGNNWWTSANSVTASSITPSCSSCGYALPFFSNNKSCPRCGKPLDQA